MYKPLIDIISKLEKLKTLSPDIVDTLDALEVIADKNYKYIFEINEIEPFSISLRFIVSHESFDFVYCGVLITNNKITERSGLLIFSRGGVLPENAESVVRYKKEYMIKQIGNNQDLFLLPYEWVEKVYKIQYPNGFYYI